MCVLIVNIKVFLGPNQVLFEGCEARSINIYIIPHKISCRLLNRLSLIFAMRLPLPIIPTYTHPRTKRV